MKTLIEIVVKAVVRGLMYTAGFGFVGGLAGLILKKGFLTGAYVAVFIGAIAAMAVAVYGFIGSPKSRYAFFTQNRFEDRTEKPMTVGHEGVYPALVAIVMLLMGFVIEAMLH